MTFASLGPRSFEALRPNARSPFILPGPVPPARGDAPSPQDPNYAVNDEFIRLLPFVSLEPPEEPHPQQAQVRSQGVLVEPNATARAGGTAWTPGASSPFGQELEFLLSRLKTIRVTVRTDALMTGAPEADEMLTAQVRLAEVAVVRAVSEAVFHSNPATDDDAELAGLPFFLGFGSPQDVAYDPAGGLMRGLAEIAARCCPSDGDYGSGPDVLALTRRGRWRLETELEAKGISPDYHYCPLTDDVRLHFHGIPTVEGRLPEPSSAGGTTDAWALKLFGPSGCYFGHKGGDSFEFGLRREFLPSVSRLDASGEVIGSSRAVDVFVVGSLMVPEPNSIARLYGVPIEAP
jgi:hypothetical protein